MSEKMVDWVLPVSVASEALLKFIEDKNHTYKL